MTEVHWVDMAHPADTQALHALLADAGPVERVAVLARTDGPGVPDENRRRARQALDAVLAPWASTGHAALVLAHGCEGVATPGAYALLRRHAPAGQPTGLRFGIARSKPVPLDEIGTPAMVDHAAAAVAAAAIDAELGRHEVALALVKLPTRPLRDDTGEPWRSDSRRGRALAALGVAVALGEIERAAITAASVAADPALFSRRAMTFAGPETLQVEAVVLGQVAPVPGAADNGLRIGVCHPADLLDASALRALLRTQGLAFDADGALLAPERVLAVLSKAGPRADGQVRGAPTAIFGTAIAPDSHMRAAQSGLLGALFGRTRFFVSGDPVQQAPEGGGVVAVITQEVGP